MVYKYININECSFHLMLPETKHCVVCCRVSTTFAFLLIIFVSCEFSLVLDFIYFDLFSLSNFSLFDMGLIILFCLDRKAS